MKKNFIWLAVAGVVLGGMMFFSEKTSLLTTNVLGMKTETVVLQTNMGDIHIKLLHQEAPRLAENFAMLAKDGFYDNTIFHRVIQGFMIQGGDFENFNGTGGHAHKGGMLEDEFSPNLSHVRGAVSMANRGANTNGSQFFIMHQDGTFLDGRHSIFGQVEKGMEIVDKIAQAKTDLNDAPLERVTIKKTFLH